jgi:hypothetical protein
VGKEIGIPRCENEASAQLKRIQAELVLTVPCSIGALAASGIIAAKNVQQVSGAEAGDFVGAAFLVNQQRKIDSRFPLKNARVVAVAQADGCEASAFPTKRWLVFAQLRDVLAAKDSSVMAKKHQDGSLSLPQRSQADFPAGGVGKNNVEETLAKSFRHVRHHRQGGNACQAPPAK